MASNGIEQIVIRHLSGSKANQIEHIALAGVKEITIGRDPASNIAFDSARDDIVSRRHAAIKVTGNGQVSFRLADLGSNNGTYLNGKRLTEETELLPEDTVELGKNGVKFVFDVQPRPAHLVARTRVMDVAGSAATRIMETAETAASTAVQNAVTKNGGGPAFQTYEPQPKSGIGKETVLRMLGEERRAAKNIWIAAVAGLAVVIALGGGLIYWLQIRGHQGLKEEMREQQANLERSMTEKHASLEQLTQEKLGFTPQEIVNQFGNATAQIERAWRLYDQKTGKPVFHQTFSIKAGGEHYTYPAYVRLPGSLGIVRWLTLEDDNRTNIEIGGQGSGTGFVVSEQGFMLTNKHVAASWNLAFGQHDRANRYGYGWLYEYGGGPGARSRKLRTPQRIDLSDDDYAFLKRWVPASGGIVFARDVAFPVGQGNIPDPAKGGTHTFFGRNDVLEVRFANSRLSANANLVRFSNDSDAALIKVDTPQQLHKVDIAPDDRVTVGEPVMALGYPAVAEETVARSTTVENGQYRENTETVPLPFVTEGIVALVSPAVKTENGVTVGGTMGDVIQMTINSTGAGNSGGPVFNKEGKVIGLFTYGISAGGANTSGAVPIKYGRDLLQAQHP